MNYHNITHDDMLNGEGLRVTLWVSGCTHNCDECQNPQTHDPCSGIIFDKTSEAEIMEELSKDYISGITISGGDPLHENNVEHVYELILKIKKTYGESKNIWLYSGYTLEEIMSNSDITSYESFYSYLRRRIVKSCDVFVDGRFVKELKDNNFHWAGSSNQRILRKGIDY